MRHIAIYRNWRVWALMALMVPTIVLLLGEAESVGLLIAGKCAAILLVYIIYRLASSWARRGKLDDLINYIRED